MFKRRFTFTCLLLAVFALSLPTFAQQDDEDLLAYVVAAYDNMVEIETMTITATQLIDQTLEVDGITVTQTVEQKMDGLIRYSEDPAVEMTLVQSFLTQSGFETIEVDLTMDMIQVDETFYMRFYDVSDDFANVYPEGWVNVTDNPGDMPGMELLNVEQLTSMMNTTLQYPINADTVSSVEEIEDAEAIEAIEDVEMRTFVLEIDMEALQEADELEDIAGMFNAGTTGVDVDAMMSQMFDGATMTLEIWIGTDDQLIHRIDMIMNTDAEIEGMIPGMGAVDMVQTLTGTYTYSNFDESFEIEAPSDL
jgi:hypothetical protein